MSLRGLSSSIFIPVNYGMEEKDVYRSAKLLIDKYGADAPKLAASRRDAMKERGDLPRMQVWIRIGRAIDKLQSTDAGTVH